MSRTKSNNNNNNKKKNNTKTKSQGSSPTPVPLRPTRRAINDAGALEDLEKLGFCVFAEVANQTQRENLHSGFWDFIEKFSPTISRNSSKTWNNNWPDKANKGMITAPFVGQADFMWQGRELCAPAFEKIWGTSQLLTSFDRCNAFRPPSVDPSWKTSGGWYHVDQNGINKKGLHCYQGFIDILGSSEDDGGIVVVPKSHLIFNEMFSGGFGTGKGDFCILTSPLLKKYVTNPVKICLEPGDLFIWDSRVIHCNAPGNQIREKTPKEGENKLDRLVLYIAMTPISKASREIIYQKQTAVLKTGDATSHWPHEHFVAGREVSCEHEWNYIPPVLNERQKQLGGLA